MTHRRHFLSLLAATAAFTTTAPSPALDPALINWENVTSELGWAHYLGRQKVLSMHIGEFAAVKKLNHARAFGPTPFPAGKHAVKLLDLGDGASQLAYFALEVQEDTSYFLLTFPDGASGEGVKQTVLTGPMDRSKLEGSTARVMPLMPGLQIAWDTSTDKEVSKVEGTPLLGESPFKSATGFRQTLLIKGAPDPGKGRGIIGAVKPAPDGEGAATVSGDGVVRLPVWIPRDTQPGRWVILVHPARVGGGLEASAVDVGGRGLHTLSSLRNKESFAKGTAVGAGQ